MNVKALLIAAALLAAGVTWWIEGTRWDKDVSSLKESHALALKKISDTGLIRKHFNVVLERTVRELRGEPCLELEEFAPTKQQIVCSRSFGDRVTEYELMREAICSHAVRAAEKLRGERQYCRHISEFVKTSPFSVNEVYYGKTAGTKLQARSRTSISCASKAGPS